MSEQEQIAELQAELAAARQKINELTKESRAVGMTALGMVQLLEYMADALHALHQISPRKNAAQRRAISKTIHQQLQDRVQTIESDLQIRVTNGTAFSISPDIVNQLEQFIHKVQSMQATTAHYIPPESTRGPKSSDVLIKKTVEGWLKARINRTPREEYCKDRSISISTLKRYLNEYEKRRIDLLDLEI